MSKNVLWRLAVVSICVALVLGMGAGCKGKKQAPLDTGITTGTGPETTSGDGQPDVDLENLLFEPGSQYGLQTVYFDFDSSSLRGDAMATLRGNADKIKQVPGVIIQLAGHCDERGTQEYNLALGERRALAVREHLIQLGISGNRLITISYGEESPAVMGSGESAWAKNRRCEFNRAR
jgi:peptidoglycan-associated lipoprotein